MSFWHGTFLLGIPWLCVFNCDPLMWVLRSRWAMRRVCWSGLWAAPRAHWTLMSMSCHHLRIVANNEYRSRWMVSSILRLWLLLFQMGWNHRLAIFLVSSWWHRVPVLIVAFSNHGFTSMSPVRMRSATRQNMWPIKPGWSETSRMAVLFFQGLSRCKFDFKIEKTSKIVLMIYDDSATIWNEDENENEDDHTDEYHYCNYHYCNYHYYNYHCTMTQLS